MIKTSFKHYRVLYARSIKNYETSATEKSHFKHYPSALEYVKMILFDVA